MVRSGIYREYISNYMLSNTNATISISPPKQTEINRTRLKTSQTRRQSPSQTRNRGSKPSLLISDELRHAIEQHLAVSASSRFNIVPFTSDPL